MQRCCIRDKFSEMEYVPANDLITYELAKALHGPLNQMQKRQEKGQANSEKEQHQSASRFQ